MIDRTNRTETVRSATSWVEVDPSAVRHNLALLRQAAAPAAVAAVVKADAYGHGAVTVARAALDAGASRLCTFTVREAIDLRCAGIDAPILCLGPVLSGDCSGIAKHDISCVVDSAITAQRLAVAARSVSRPIAVHINLDSGMHRYGHSMDQAMVLVEAVRCHAELLLEGVFTHFADASNPDQTATTVALDRFHRAADRIGAPIRHASASAATFLLPQDGLDFVRAGIALYGIDPAPELSTALTGQLQPVLSWRTRIIATRRVRTGETVSYGGLWTAPADTRIGVIGVGYADGLRRSLSGADVLIRGRRAPIRGAICMDSAMIDLTDIPQSEAGDVVTIIGDGGDNRITAWELANRIDTIPYEIVTGIAMRVPRIAPLNETELVDKLKPA